MCHIWDYDWTCWQQRPSKRKLANMQIALLWWSFEQEQLVRLHADRMLPPRDAQIASDFKSNQLALSNRRDSNHCDCGCDFYPSRWCSAISNRARSCDPLWFGIVVITILGCGHLRHPPLLESSFVPHKGKMVEQVVQHCRWWRQRSSWAEPGNGHHCPWPRAHASRRHTFASGHRDVAAMGTALQVSDEGEIMSGWYTTQWPPQPVECYTISASPPRQL